MAPATEAELKTYLGITGSDDYTAGIAAGVKDWIEGYTGRRWQIDTSRERVWRDSGDAVENDPLDTTETTLLVTNADAVDPVTGIGRFQVGQLLRVGTEIMYVSGVEGLADQLTVVRGAGGPAAPHLQGTTIYVSDNLDGVDLLREYDASSLHVGGRRLMFYEDMARGTYAGVQVEGRYLADDDVRPLLGAGGDVIGLELTRFGTQRRWTSHTDFIKVRGAWYTTWGADAIKAISLELGQYLYMSRQSGSGGQAFIASRQTGLVVQQDMVPERIIARLETYRRRS